MAKIPSFKKILREKFPSDLDWLDFLILPLNKFMDDIALAMQNRLTFSENMDAEVKQIAIDGTYPVKVNWNRHSKPTIGLVGKIEMADNSAVSLSTAITLIWSYNQDGQIEINDIVGFDASGTKKYIITVVFLTK